MVLKVDKMDCYDVSVRKTERSCRDVAKVLGAVGRIELPSTKISKTGDGTSLERKSFVSGVLSSYKGDIEKAGGFMGLEVRGGNLLGATHLRI